MLKMLYTIIEAVANLSALLCPVAIGHWLLMAMLGGASTPLDGPLGFISGFFKPFNHLVGSMLPNLPTIAYQGQNISLEQPVFGMLLTGVFFIMTLVASVLKTTEQKLALQKEIEKQNARRLTQERLKLVDEQRLDSNRHLLVYVSFQFAHNPTYPDLENNANQNFYQVEGSKGRLLQTLPDGLLILFNQPQDALRYIASSSQGLLQFYQTLRPMDPQPPYRIVLDVCSASPNTVITVEPYQNLAKYCGANQTLLTDDAKRLLEYRKLMTDFPTESLGYYGMANGESHELFIQSSTMRR
jgi:hypothetical protein